MPNDTPLPFPVTYVLDRLAPSETFIQRELDQLRRRSWPVYTRLLRGGVDALPYSFFRCPYGFRGRFLRIAIRRVLILLFHSPVDGLRLLRRIPQAAALAQKVMETASELIVAQFAGITAEISGLVSETLGVPWCCSVHAHDVFTVKPSRLAARLAGASGVVACSQMAVRAVTESGVPENRVVMIHHGLHLNDFPFDTIQPDGAIFTACRFTAKKGLETLLKACALLKDQGLDFTCTIAGDGPLRDSLKRLRRRLGLLDTVDLLGWQSQEETRSFLMDSTVLVLPSRRLKNGDRDGIPNVMIESMALGTPVVTTTASAAGEVIEDGANGWLVPPEDPAALAAALQHILQSRNQCFVVARNARRTVEQFFDEYKNVRQLESFFSGLIALRKGTDD